MRLLIDYNAKVNIVNNGNVATIHYSAANASPLATKILIDSGAKVNIQTKPTLRPDEWSINYVMNKDFYEGNVSKIAQFPGSLSPLHIVASNEGFWFQTWVDENGEPTRKGEEFMRYHRDTCRLLVKAGGNVHLLNTEGETAYEIANYMGNEKPKEEWEKVLSRSSRECAKIFSTERSR